MKAVILAGGAGTRLREIIKDVPKPMSPIAGKPFLEYLLLQLIRQGISDIIISTGYKGDVIESYFGNGEKWNARLTYSKENKPLGTAGALKKAARLIDDDDFIAMNGDSFLDLNFNDFISFHKKQNAIATIGLICVNDISRYGMVEIDGKGEIIRFTEKNTGKHGFVNGGVYIFKREIVENIPAGTVSLENTVLPALIGHGLYGLMVKGFFVDIGVPNDYLFLCKNYDKFHNAVGLF